MQNPWDVSPRRDKGDDNEDAIYLEVGRALSHWESLESAMAEFFDTLVSSQPSNRAAYSAFISVVSSSARTQLLEAAFLRAIKQDDPIYAPCQDLIMQFGKFGARRNEIAHGIVYNLGESGMMLGPNNIMKHKWTDLGQAKFQYTAADIQHYRSQFVVLFTQVSHLRQALLERSSSATNRTKWVQERRDR